MPRSSSGSTRDVPTAYSYIRFSSKSQADGDSLRRQTERAEGYCLRRGWKIDTTLSLPDLGVSAFRGKNALLGNLGRFLEAIKQRRVTPGSVLIVESFDRLSRQGIDEGYDLVKGILKAGVRIVTLSPEREFDIEATKGLSKGALEIQLILERAAEESERKSDRIGSSWKEKKKNARNGIVMTARLPAWVRCDKGKLVPIRERAAIVKRIFRLAATGYGIPAILKRLEVEKLPAFGRIGTWTRAYLAIMLKDRRAIGEYQPRKGKANDGEPIKNYYPPVVTENEWLAARGGMEQRRKNPGRISKAQVNIFAGILKHAREGDSYIMTQRLSRSPTKKTTKHQVLINTNGDTGKSRAYSLPYSTFESAVISCLREINPSEILPGNSPGDVVPVLESQLAGVEAEIAKAVAFMEKNGFSTTIGKRIADLESKQGSIQEGLEAARHEARNPIAETWKEAQTLLDSLAKTKDPHAARMRLRGALRRVVDSMWLLVVPRGIERLAVLQVHFREGGRRDYWFRYRQATRSFGKPRCAEWQVRSIRADKFPIHLADLRGNEEGRDPDPIGSYEKWLVGTPLTILFPKEFPVHVLNA